MITTSVMNIIMQFHLYSNTTHCCTNLFSLKLKGTASPTAFTVLPRFCFRTYKANTCWKIYSEPNNCGTNLPSATIRMGALLQSLCHLPRPEPCPFPTKTNFHCKLLGLMSHVASFSATGGAWNHPVRSKEFQSKSIGHLGTSNSLP